MTIKAILKITKKSDKANISASISPKEDGTFRSWNFTGNLVALEGYITKDKKNYDEALVAIDCATTAIIFNEDQGNAIYERCGQIFAERAANGDINPAVDLHLELKTVRPKETNILLLNITRAYVDANTQIVDTSATVDETIAKLQANSKKAAEQRELQQSTRPQVSAARNSLNIAKKIIKTYL